MNAEALSLTPSVSFNELFLIKGLLWRGERGVLKEQMETNKGRGRIKPMSMLTLSKKKLPDFSNNK